MYTLAVECNLVLIQNVSIDAKATVIELYQVQWKQPDLRKCFEGCRFSVITNIIGMTTTFVMTSRLYILIYIVKQLYNIEWSLWSDYSH